MNPFFRTVFCSFLLLSSSPKITKQEFCSPNVICKEIYYIVCFIWENVIAGEIKHKNVETICWLSFTLKYTHHIM